MDDKLTSYCGLYCPDCIPSKGELFSLIEKVDILLEDLHFEEYAALKSKSYPKMQQYSVFSEVLKEIKFLQCHEPCSSGGGKNKCNIRSCCLGNNLEGCWECGERNSCDLLQPLIQVHPNLYNHYELIREHGMDDWAQFRKAHYKWEEGKEA